MRVLKLPYGTTVDIYKSGPNSVLCIRNVEPGLYGEDIVAATAGLDTEQAEKLAEALLKATGSKKVITGHL